MKRLQLRFVLLLFCIVLASSVLGTALAGTLSRLLFPHTGLGKIILFSFALKELLVPLLTVLICLIIVSVTSKKLVSPIVTLSQATKEIAAGNFDISFTPTGRKDELGELERSFSIMVKELRSNELMRKDFVVNVSHEFKTPLSIIQGYAKLLTEDDLMPEERQGCAALIVRESERLSKLSANILRISKLDNQGIISAPACFLIDEQIRQVILFLEPKWQEKQIEFDIDLPAFFYRGDEELLSQVWINLIENALKFSSSAGKISIRMSHTDTAVRVEIADQGVGMDETIRVRIFEQFYQGDPSHSKDGNGLGLPIVKRIIELHGGAIEVCSEPGAGTTFAVFLPIKNQQPDRRGKTPRS